MHARNQFPYDCIKLLGTFHKGHPSTLSPKSRHYMRGCMNLALWITIKCGQGMRGSKMLRMSLMNGPLDNRCASVAASSFMPTWRGVDGSGEMKRKRRRSGGVSRTANSSISGFVTMPERGSILHLAVDRLMAELVQVCKFCWINHGGHIKLKLRHPCITV